jgi:ABC-type sugar transport system ATPase subunit
MEEAAVADTPLLQAKEIVKSFPGTLAVDQVDFVCNGGEIHGLVGENGAGKSTLIKVVAGVHLPDGGTLLFRGERRAFRNYADARKAGVGVVYQELSLLPDLTVAENISMGTWPKNNRGLIDWDETNRRSERILQQIGVELEPNVLVSSLPMAQRQMVEIAKVLSEDPDIIIFDEPTAPLSKDEVKLLFDILRDLKNRGKAIVFISHRLDEVLEISDQITVMKDGRRVITQKASEFSEDKLISSMVGRSFSEIFPPKPPMEPTEVIFSYSGVLKSSGKKVAFSVRKGEVLGVGGLQGQGQMEMLQSIFGLGECEDLELEIQGQRVTSRNPVQAMKVGIGLIPENRGEEGVFLILSALENLAAPTLERRDRFGWIRKRKERQEVSEIVDRLAIKISSLDQPAQSLSGGNMQKLVLGKWLIFEPKVMVMLEPTKGVDVSTKQQIYRLIRELADRGVAVVLNTSDMLELIGLCDRVLVMNHGFFTAELGRDEITEENIMKGSVSQADLLEEKAV